MHVYIELQSYSLSTEEADRQLSQLLASYGQAITPDMRAGHHTLIVTDPSGTKQNITFAELAAQLHLVGTCELDRMRWREMDPYGTIEVRIPEGLPPVVIGTGPRMSDALTGPGYLTNDVVGEFLTDVLHYRREVALNSVEDDMFRRSFRAYRSYLAACISSIDAFLNRLSWFTRHQPVVMSQQDFTILSRKTLPLDEKLRKWIPIVTGKTLSEKTDAWADYSEIKLARNAIVHANNPDFMFAVKDAVGVLNLCRRGVGIIDA